MSSQHFRIVALPYRDYWYQLKYGSTVRDLALLNALARHPSVVEVVALCRPRVLYEPLDFIRASPRAEEVEGIRWQICRSFDPFGPLRRRAWTKHAYDAQTRLHLDPRRAVGRGAVTLFLDFHPIAAVCDTVRRNMPGGIYWYDLIDNFRKHNRYSEAQIALVSRKYEQVGRCAALVTGVSAAAVAEVASDNRLVLPNRQYVRDIGALSEYTGEFDFGYLGFISDKFDVDLVAAMSRQGKRVLIAGEVLDRSVGDRLRSLPGVVLSGRYHRDEIDALVRRFAIGLVPYRQEREHDGSPLKAYQYISKGRAVISTLAYDDMPGRWVAVGATYDAPAIQSLVQRVERAVGTAFAEHAREVAAGFPVDATWEATAAKAIARLEEVTHGR